MKNTPGTKPELFPLGRLVATPGALALCGPQPDLLFPLIARHAMGDWGTVCNEDKDANNQALLDGNRLLSAYEFHDAKVWVITEADRSVTTVLLPEEY